MPPPAHAPCAGVRSASPLAGPPPAPLLPFAASPEALPLDQGHLATVHAQPAVPPSPWPTCAAGVSQPVTQTWSPAPGGRLAREPVASGRSGGGAAPSPLSLRPSCVRTPQCESSKHYVQTTPAPCAQPTQRDAMADLGSLLPPSPETWGPGVTFPSMSFLPSLAGIASPASAPFSPPALPLPQARPSPIFPGW